MEEMITWDMIFNKVNSGKRGNECPSKNEIASIERIEVTGNHADNELVGLDHINIARPQAGNYTFHVVNSVQYQFDAPGDCQINGDEITYTMHFSPAISKLYGYDSKIHTLSNDIEQVRIKFRGASIEEGYNNKTLTFTQVDSSNLGDILTDMRYYYGNSTTFINDMTLNCSIQNDFSNSHTFAFNITGKRYK